MQTFTRTKTAQRKDQYGYLVFCFFLSMLFAFMGYMGLTTKDVPLAAVFVVLAISVALAVLGLWLFKKIPVITAIHLMPQEVIINYLHHPARSIPRSKILDVSMGMAAHPQGSYNCLLVKGEHGTEYLAVHGGYRDERGRHYGGKAMVHKLRELLAKKTPDDGVDNDESGVWHYGRS